MSTRKFMKSKTLTCITGITLFATLAIPELATQHTRYKLIDISPFGGPSSYINPAFTFGSPNQINSHGTTVGVAATSIPITPTSSLFVCGGPDGLVPFVFHAFEWQNGVVTDLGSLSSSDNCSIATSINARGEIVGYSENGVVDPLLGSNEVRGVFWKDGAIEDLGTFGGSDSVASAINNRGQVVGCALNGIPDPFSYLDFQIAGSSGGTQTRAFLWQNGAKRDLGTLGGPDACGTLLNERGQVAGASYTNSAPNPDTGIPTQDPFLWENGRMIDLGSLGGTNGQPTAINNAGQVVGFSNLAGDTQADLFLWIRG